MRPRKLKCSMLDWVRQTMKKFFYNMLFFQNTFFSSRWNNPSQRKQKIKMFNWCICLLKHSGTISKNVHIMFSVSFANILISTINISTSPPDDPVFLMLQYISTKSQSTGISYSTSIRKISSWEICYTYNNYYIHYDMKIRLVGSVSVIYIICINCILPITTLSITLQKLTLSKIL
jgi:hypothetical protein